MSALQLPGFHFPVSDTMFSVMAVPIENLQKIAPGIISGDCLGEQCSRPSLPTGIEEVDRFLPDGGFPRGAIAELSVVGTAAHATSLALAVCRSVQSPSQQARLHGDVGWCAFLDPTGSLYGPGLVEAGLDIGRILVARPPVGSVEKAALRIVESQAFSVVVVDVTSGLDQVDRESLAAWPRVVRRMALSLNQSSTSVILITDDHAHRPVPLPTALRLELKNVAPGQIQMRVAKDRQGRISTRRIITIRDGVGHDGAKGVPVEPRPLSLSPSLPAPVAQNDNGRASSISASV